MKPEDCPKFDNCLKIQMVLDKDILEEQASEAIRDICGRCEEVNSIPEKNEKVSLIRDMEQAAKYDKDGAPIYLTKIQKPEELRLTPEEICPECNGKGRTELLGRCWNCEGTGKVKAQLQKALKLDKDVCSECGGTGSRVVTEEHEYTYRPVVRCHYCKGTGKAKSHNRPDRDTLINLLCLKDITVFQETKDRWLELTGLMGDTDAKELADQILALWPDIEEAKREERERIMGEIEEIFPWIKQGVNEKPWQALKSD